MKLFKLMLCAIVMVAFTACGPSYNESKCKELQKKINKADEYSDLDDKEYSEMMDQYLAIEKEALSKVKGCKTLKDVEKLYKDKKIQKMAEYESLFEYYLEGAYEDGALSASNEKKYEKMREQVDAMMDEMNDKIEELADED